jgi:hypothetical protein
MENINPRHLVLIFASLVALITGYSVTASVLRSGKTRVELIVIPSSVEVAVNNKRVSSRTLYLEPGDYVFKARGEGFKEYTEEVLVENNPLEVGLVPEPITAAARKQTTSNPDIQIQREAIGGENAARKGERLRRETPLLTQLPRMDVGAGDPSAGAYEIHYGPAANRKDGVFIEIVNSSPNGRKSALKWIREQGQDPTDLEIRYTDFSNPLGIARGTE